jgi:hypothetical protein
MLQNLFAFSNIKFFITNFIFILTFSCIDYTGAPQMGTFEIFSNFLIFIKITLYKGFSVREIDEIYRYSHFSRKNFYAMFLYVFLRIF